MVVVGVILVAAPCGYAVLTPSLTKLRIFRNLEFRVSVYGEKSLLAINAQLYIQRYTGQSDDTPVQRIELGAWSPIDDLLPWRRLSPQGRGNQITNSL